MLPARDLVIIYACVFATILACRVVPMFVLKGRKLPERVSQAFSLIPPAAFAALVTNDLLDPAAIARDPLRGLVPVAAALPVFLVAKKTGSLIWSAICGMAIYAGIIYLLL